MSFCALAHEYEVPVLSEPEMIAAARLCALPADGGQSRLAPRFGTQVVFNAVPFPLTTKSHWSCTIMTIARVAFRLPGFEHHLSGVRPPINQDDVEALAKAKCFVLHSGSGGRAGADLSHK
jgi:hypothetical protein